MAQRAHLQRVVVLEDGVLRLAIGVGRDPVGIPSRAVVAGLLRGAPDRLGVGGLLLQHARDHRVALHLGGQGAAIVEEVLDAPGGLHEMVEDPLLVVALPFELHG